MTGVARGGVLRNRSYLRIWLAASISNFGTMMHGMALPFIAIAALGATPADIALLSASGLLPGLLLGGIAGAWLDRLPRRPLLVATDALRGVVVLAIAVAALRGWLDLPLLYALTAALGLLGFLFEAGHHAILPDVVEAEELVEANSKLSGAEAVAEGIGFAAGGWLIQIIGAPLVLACDAITYALSAAGLVGVRTKSDDEAEPSRSPDDAPSADGAEPARSVWREAGEGLRFIAGEPRLLTLAVTIGGTALAWRMIGPVYFVYVYDELGFLPGVLGLVFAVGGVSSLFGALSCTAVTRRLGEGRTMVLGLALFGLSVAVLPLAPGATFVGIAVLVANQLGDGFEVLFDVNQRSLRQRITPGPMLGRVASSLQIVSSAGMLLGVFLGGVLGETLGLRPTFLVAAAILIAAAIYLAASPITRR